MKECDRAQKKVATTKSAKLQVAKVAPTALFDHFKWHSSNVPNAEAAVQARMNLRNFMKTVFEQVKQST